MPKVILGDGLRRLVSSGTSLGRFNEAYLRLAKAQGLKPGDRSRYFA